MGASLVAPQYRIHLPVREMWVWSLGQEYSLEKEMAQYSCLENSMNREACRATVREGRKEMEITEQLNNSHKVYI